MEAENYKISRYVMSWIGQWPEQTGFNRFFLSFHLIFAVGSQLCLQICSLVAVWRNWRLVMECSSTIIIHTLCLVKFFNCFLNAYKMKSLFAQTRNSWSLATLDDEVKILQSCTDKGKKLIKTYAIIIYGSTSIYMILPVTPSIMALFAKINHTQADGLLYRVDAVFNVEKYYYFILLHSYYTTFFLMTIPIATDSMLIIYVQHVCGLFEVIGYQLKNVRWSNSINVNVYPRHEDDEHYRLISDSIAKHTEILEFVKLLGSAYSKSLFILTLLNVIIMAFSGIQAVMNTNRPLAAFKFVVTGLFLTIHFLFLCIPGQKLTDYSTKINESIYAAKWYAISIRARKLLNLMLMRCRTPCQITILKISALSLRKFSLVLQAALSYFTMFRSLA